MTTSSSLALVGVTGGAGTTRLTVEFGATLARAGRDVALVDAAFATQGLATHVPGRIDPDVTALVTDATDLALDAGLAEYPVDLPGRLAVCPARAPFERLARAKTPEAARQFEDRLATAARQFDHVIVDVPPVADNQALAAVSAADRVGAVVPATERGFDRVPAMQDRLHDVNAPADAVIANRVDEGETLEGVDATVPESDATAVSDLPVCADPETTFAPAVAAAVETAFETTLDLSFPEEGLFDGYR
ncbi:AAA family ATPase [Halorientalis salina]|uniref:AAA family ATPase n=1 Tax=Halorientalis salina TaxID=2932266 RepID=UPI0010ACCA57|nr:AAA family ATPase [Halorientalis salina]